MRLVCGASVWLLSGSGNPSPDSCRVSGRSAVGVKANVTAADRFRGAPGLPSVSCNCWLERFSVYGKGLLESERCLSDYSSNYL